MYETKIKSKYTDIIGSTSFVNKFSSKGIISEHNNINTKMKYQNTNVGGGEFRAFKYDKIENIEQNNNMNDINDKPTEDEKDSYKMNYDSLLIEFNCYYGSIDRLIHSNIFQYKNVNDLKCLSPELLRNKDIFKMSIDSFLTNWKLNEWINKIEEKVCNDKKEEYYKKKKTVLSNIQKKLNSKEFSIKLSEFYDEFKKCFHYMAKLDEILD